MIRNGRTQPTTAFDHAGGRQQKQGIVLNDGQPVEIEFRPRFGNRPQQLGDCRLEKIGLAREMSAPM